jgi:hypothetical protein
MCVVMSEGVLKANRVKAFDLHGFKADLIFR